MKTVLIVPNKENKILVKDSTQYVVIPRIGVVSIEMAFEKNGIQAELLGIFNLSENQKIELKTITTHLARDTSCNISVKGILGDGCTSNYIGKIIIEKGAYNTKSYLENNVLVNGDNTKNSSQPILEIRENDVKASHGATTGRVDESQVYYLQTRGFTKMESEKIITDGFFEDILGRINDREIAKKVKKELKNA